MSVTFYVEDSAEDEIYLNLSNANARDFLVYLGYAPLSADEVDLDLARAEFGDAEIVDPYVGQLDPSDVRGRCLLSQAVGGVLADEGTEAITYRGDGGATIHDSGRPVGYMSERAARLLEIAELAAARGKMISYC